MTRNFKLLGAGIGVAAMLGVMGATSFAGFTTAPQSISATAGAKSGPSYNGNSSNTFAAGTLGITEAFNAGEGTGNWSITRTGPDVAVAINNMAPGDTSTRAITITNTGTLSEYYNVTIGTTGSLFSMDNNTNGIFDRVSAVVSAVIPVSGNPSYPLLSNVYDQTSAPTVSSWILIKAGQSETLPITVALPFAAGNTFQHLKGNFTIGVQSQQAANTGVPDGAVENAVETPVAPAN